MKTEFLRAFAQRIAASGRIAPADVAELRTHSFVEDGDVNGLPLAEALLAIDAKVADHPEAWTNFLCDTLVDILVWDERPTGVVTPAHADWLLARIEMDGVRAVGRHRTLLVALVREAQVCDPRLAAAAFGYGDVAMIRAPVARTLGWLDASGMAV